MSLIKEGHKRAIDILNENMEVLHTMARALLEYETIDGEEVDKICNGATLEELRNLRESNIERLAKEAGEVDRTTESTSSEDEGEGEGGPVGNPGPVTV